MKAAKLSLITALALGALVALAPASRAQDNSADSKDSTKSDSATPRTRARRQTGSQIDHLATQLKLTDDQKSKLQPILQDEGKKLRDLRQDTTINAKDRRAKVREIRDQNNEKVQAFLSKDQFEQFKKVRAGTPRVAKPASAGAGAADSGSSDAPPATQAK